MAESKLIPDTEVTVSLEILNPGILATQESMDIAILTREIDREASDRILYVVPMSTSASGAGYAALPRKAAVLEGFGPSGGDIHSQDEYVEIDSIPLSLYQVSRLPGVHQAVQDADRAFHGGHVHAHRRLFEYV